MRPECLEAALAWRLVLPGRPLAGRLGERLGQGTGSSLEFMDFRDYVPGDDLRHVDWRAYARTDQLKVRLFREETSPSLDIVADVSASMAVTDTKRRALLDLLDAAREWTRRAGGHPRRLAGGGAAFEDDEVPAFDGGPGLDLVPHARLRPRGMRMVVSDFLAPEDPGMPIRRLAAGAAHLYAIQLLDAWEADPTRDGEESLLDCEEETARRDIVLDVPTVKSYKARLARLCEAVHRAVRAVGGSYALVVAGPPARMFREYLLRQGVVEPV